MRKTVGPSSWIAYWGASRSFGVPRSSVVIAARPANPPLMPNPVGV